MTLRINLSLIKINHPVGLILTMWVSCTMKRDLRDSWPCIVKEMQI